MCRILPAVDRSGYIEFVRGTPLMVQLILLFYGLPMIGIYIYPNSWIPTSPVLAPVSWLMSMNSWPMWLEIIRSVFRLWTAEDGAPGALASAAVRPWAGGPPQAIRNILRRWAQRVSRHQGILHCLRDRHCDDVFRTTIVIAVTYKNWKSVWRRCAITFCDLVSGGRGVSGGKETVME